MPKDKMDSDRVVLTGNQVFFNKLSPDAKIPSYSKHGDAGMDLTAIEDDFLSKGERAIVKTGLRVKIPKGTVGLICPRSGLASKSGITVINSPGILDEKYRGELMVALINTSNTGYQVSKGDRIAQLVITPFVSCEIFETEDFDENTERGTGGFGSSGK